MREIFVLDTSLFTNPHIYKQFGDDRGSALQVFSRLAVQSNTRYYMPYSVYLELRKMEDLSEVSAEFEAAVRIRSPRRFSLMIPSEVLYEFIEEVRMRIDRGLRIAEDSTRAGVGTALGTDVGPLIKRLREKHREAMRQGIIDSKEDLDVMLLAYELDGTLVSADQGLLTWADKVGINLIDPANFRRIMESLAKLENREGFIQNA